MRKSISTILVTGGAGFIGSEFVRQAIEKGNGVIVVDKLTYAGDLARLGDVKGKYKFYKTDICDRKKIAAIFKSEKPKIVVHFAAESHVDRSIRESDVFIETNVKGTHVLLEESRNNNVKKFIHISTDEVYGEIKKGKFSESAPLNPSSPYSASKAAADCLVKSYIRTYHFPAIIIRPSNNYGPWQYPEKFIPLSIWKASRGESIPLYGKGVQQREWLFVNDCAHAIMHILRKGAIGAIYNVGSGCEQSNIEVAKKILTYKKKPKNLIRFIADRPGHDFRYCLNSLKIRQLAWWPQTTFEKGLCLTIDWCRRHQPWLKRKAKNFRSMSEKIYC